MDTPRCTACNSKLATIEYQARAADEATRVTTVCPLCPVKASKIKPRAASASVPRGLLGLLPYSGRQTQQVVKPLRQRSRIVMLTTGSNTQVHGQQQLKHTVIHTGATHSRSVSAAATSQIKAYYNTSGLNEKECWSILDSTVLGMNVEVQRLQLYSGFNMENSGRKVMMGMVTLMYVEDEIQYWKYEIHESDKVYIYVEAPGVIQPRDAAKIVTRLYLNGHMPNSLHDYMRRHDVSKLADLAPRGWDISKPRDAGYKYTSKPDGERVWLVLVGYYWYMCEKAQNRRIIKFAYDYDATSQSAKPLVIDAEYVAGEGNLLIDCLTQEDGSYVPITRDVSDMLRVFNEIKHNHPACPCTSKQYFDNPNDAKNYCSVQRYPTDGIVGIRDGSTETVKIKEVKDIEVWIKDKVALLTSDNDLLGTCSTEIEEADGTVLDLRFAAKAGDTQLRISEVFPRTDKSRANGTEAIKNILNSCVNVVSRDDNERREALMWSSKLRETLVKRALNCNQNRYIMLDVGTGTGQSLDSALGTDSVSYVYVEPDTVRAHQVARRAGGTKVTTDPMDIIYNIKGLRTRAKKAMVLNAPLSSISDSETVCSGLMPYVRCVIATYSAQYVVPELHKLREQYSCQIVACMHTYDDANGDVLVDALGATMKKTKDGMATYKWGGDKEHTEPVTYADDYFGLGTVVKGSDILPMPKSTFSPSASDICKTVRVVVP